MNTITIITDKADMTTTVLLVQAEPEAVERAIADFPALADAGYTVELQPTESVGDTDLTELRAVLEERAENA